MPVTLTSQHRAGNGEWFLSSVSFILSALPFIALGNAMGREFKNFPALQAYAINTAGSLAGLLIFSLLSHFFTPPLVWFAFGGILFLLLAGKGQNTILPILCLGIIIYMVKSFLKKTMKYGLPTTKSIITEIRQQPPLVSTALFISTC